MNLTQQQLATLRTRPHKTKLWLSIYRPKTLFAAYVTGSYQQGETDITYYNNYSGTYLLAYPNTTALIGSSAGASDIGRIRMRSASGTYAIFAENNIVWQTGQHITVIDNVDVNPKYPVIVKDPDNDENVIFYKDSDIPYTNQNSVYGSLVNMGSHRAAFRETGSVSIYWTATGTSNVADSSLTYSWHFEGGTPTGSTALTPGYVSWNTPGHYRVTLTVSAANGGVDKAYRYVSIYDRPENGTSTPFLKWELQDFEGNRGQGGYVASIKVFENLGDIEPNALVVIFADDWYGGTKGSLGGNGQNNSKIVFVGYILKDSIQFNWKAGYAEFQAGSVTEVMKQTEGFSVSCESKVTASTWFELSEMTVKKALYHYLRWHSTVLNIADFQYTGDDRYVQYFDADRSSLYDAIQSFVSEGLIGEVVADRQGKIWAEISPEGYENPITSIANGMTVHKHDWVNDPNVSKRRVEDVSFVEMGGIVYDGAQTNTYQALLSDAPSLTPLYRGKSESPRQGLILLSQAQLNQLSGNYLAARNSPIEDVTLSMAGNYRNLDIAPQEKTYLLITPQDNAIGTNTTGLPFRLTSMNWLYNSEQESFYPDVSFEQIVTGTAGQTLIIPAEPPDDGYNYPPFELPPFPDFPSTPLPEQLSTTVLIADAGKGILYTKNFDSASPDWILWNTGIDSTDITNLIGYYYSKWFVAPNGSVWVGVIKNVNHTGMTKIYYAPYIGGEFSVVMDNTMIEAQFGGSAANNRIYGMGFNPEQPEQIAMILQVNDGAGNVQGTFVLGDHSGFTAPGAILSNEGSRGGRSRITYGDGEWSYIHNAFSPNGSFCYRISADGTSILSQIDTGGYAGIPLDHIRAGVSQTLMTLNVDDTGQYNPRRSTDGGNTWTTINLGSDKVGMLAMAPDGTFMMGTWTTTGYRGRSGDGGYSWSGLPTLPPGGAYAFAYAGGEGVLSKWIAAKGVIRYSPNFGNTWVNKEGNIAQWIPVNMDIRGIIPVIINSEGQIVQQ